MEVRVLAKSRSPQGKLIVSLELAYPRFIHAELMAHRMFSRNGQSSRAVPVTKSLSQPPVYPTMWGKNKAGMSSDECLSTVRETLCKALWAMSAYVVRASAAATSKLGLHKQWANRPLEWQQDIKVVVTSTEWENFFNLRLDSKTVQPEMVELARMIKHEIDLTPEVELQPGEWHLPYIRVARSPITGTLYYHTDSKYVGVSLEDAKKISVSCCAQVSYRNLDMSLTKAEKVIKMLTKADDPHLSPFEHQATPMEFANDDGWDHNPSGWCEGVTHMDKKGNYWSGNFQGWIQNRQLWSFK